MTIGIQVALATTLGMTALAPMSCDNEEAGPIDDPTDVGGKGDVPVSDDQIVATTNNNLSLLFG